MCRFDRRRHGGRRGLARASAKNSLVVKYTRAQPTNDSFCADAVIPWTAVRVIGDRLDDGLTDDSVMSFLRPDGTADAAGAVRFMVTDPAGSRARSVPPPVHRAVANFGRQSVIYGYGVGGVRQSSAELTRERLVATARRLFADKGYFATGTTEIVAEAGVGTRGALYHHFPTKEALFAAVLEEVETDLAAKVGPTLTGATWWERLGQALEGFLDASLEPEVRRILLIDGPAVLGWDAWREVEARNGIGAIRLMLEEGSRDGSVKVADAESMAHLLLSVVDEAALYIAHADDPVGARSAAGRSVAALLSGLAAP